MIKCAFVYSLLLSVTHAFMAGPSRKSAVKLGYGASNINGLGSSNKATTSANTAVDFLQTLLSDLPNGAGALLENSALGWRTAIYQAVGAPSSADEKIVAKALTDAMSKSDNQFAILMGKAEPFVAAFPSDPVDYQEGASFVEVQLREAKSDELLVTMGIQLTQRETDGQWLVAKLDWQDFRDEFYPGKSGREWLRAF